MNRVRETRMKQGLTLLELSRRAKIAPGDLSAVERGLRPAFPGWRQRIAEALGVPETELFPDISEPADVPPAKEAGR